MYECPKFGNLCLTADGGQFVVFVKVARTAGYGQSYRSRVKLPTARLRGTSYHELFRLSNAFRCQWSSSKPFSTPH